jgi:hypothetical protein
MSSGDFYTVGKLCELLQTSFSKLQRAIRDSGAEPTFRMNGIEYYEAGAVERIREVIATNHRPVIPSAPAN